MRIGIIGASGNIGSRVLAEALGRGHEVIAFTRQGAASRPGQERVEWSKLNIFDAEAVARAIQRLDVLVSSFQPGNASKDPLDAIQQSIADPTVYVRAAKILLKALESRPATRLIVVGGAASLEVAPGQTIDADDAKLREVLRGIGVPEDYAVAVRGHRDALDTLRTSNRKWTYASPQRSAPVSAPAVFVSAATSCCSMPGEAAEFPTKTSPSRSSTRSSGRGTSSVASPWAIEMSLPVESLHSMPEERTMFLVQKTFGYAFILFAALLTFLEPAAVAQFPGMQPKHYPWSDATLTPDQRADLVIKEMTLDEKISLLHGHGAHFFTPPESDGRSDGTNAIERLGIPAIRMADSSYGVTKGAATGRYSTALPNNLGAASSWDPDTAFRYGALIGRELRNQGYSMSLGGGVNLTREPRDGRTFEYQGEDPLLAGTLAGNFVRGIQSEHIIGDLKHYAINDQESGRNSVNVSLGKRAMRETDLRAFEIALGISDAGGVMCSYNRVNGDFACENSYLLTEVLKKDFRFKGFVLSDWGGTHSTVKALQAGLDLEEPHKLFFGDALKKAVESGQVSEDEINEHVHRILRTIFATGLFDHPVVRQVPDVEGGYRTAQEIAEKSIVLLKNQNDVLPLSASVRSVALIGGHADLAVLSGGGSGQVDPPGGTPVPPPPPTDIFTAVFRRAWMPSSPLRALRAKMPSASISYISGDDLAAATAAAKSADVAIVFGYQWESEAIDVSTLDLPPEQNKLIDAVAAANSKTIVVLETGSPATMPWVDKVAGVVEAWYPGIHGAEALANILTGSVNPTGKLAVTFPRSDADLPHPKLALPPPESLPNFNDLHADDSNIFSVLFQILPAFQVNYDEGLKVGYKWYDAEQKPVLFPFGFGLSYTTYAYSGLTVTPGETTAVSFSVKNTGKRAGIEIAQVYASLPDAAGEPPKRLIGWTRVELAPGESKPVSVPIGRDRLTVYDEASDSWKLVPGTYVVRVGGSSQDLPLQQKVSF